MHAEIPDRSSRSDWAQDGQRMNCARMNLGWMRQQRIAHFGWWERDFSTNRVLLSDELCRIFGVQPADIPEWHQRWLNLIHPEDRSKGSRGGCSCSTRGAAL